MPRSQGKPRNFEPAKTVQRTSVSFEALAGPWSPLSGVPVRVYEIHQGRTAQHAGMAPGRVALAGGLGWQNEAGNVLGVYLHGLFEEPAVLHALFGAAEPTMDGVFDGLADVIEAAFDTGVLPGLLACSVQAGCDRESSGGDRAATTSCCFAETHHGVERNRAAHRLASCERDG